jgi:hypothetical protein
MNATAANVSIGNANYTSSTDLPKCINDAIDMANALRGGAVVKIDQTAAQMRTDVLATNGSTSPRVVYYSGHGNVGSLTGVDENGYNAINLGADLKCQVNPLTVVILDACYAAGMAYPAVDSCCIFLVACKADECTTAKLNPPKNALNSRFTEWILRGLVSGDADANSDKEVTLPELDAYLTLNYDAIDEHHQLIGGDKPGASELKIFKPVSEQPVRVPSLTNWGLIILTVLLLLSGLYVAYKRRQRVVDVQ